MDEVSGPRTARNMQAGSRDVRALGRDTETTGRQIDSAERSMGSAERRLTSMRSRTRDAHLELGILGKVISALRWPLLIAGIGGAVQALGGLAGGVTALIPKVLDLGGAAAGFGAVMIGAGASIGVVKLATQDLSKALQGNQRALKSLTPEGRAFLQTLRQMRPELASLRRTAQAGLFPGAGDLLGSLRAQMPAIRGIVGQTARDVGGLGTFLGRQLSAPGFMSDLRALGDEGSRAFGSAARSGFYFAHAVEQVLLAAGPFVDWLGTSVEHLARMAEMEARVGRETGSLGDYFDRTKQSIRTLGDIGQHVFGGLRGVMEAARGTGDSLWTSIDRVAQRFDRWANSFSGQMSMRRFFEDLRPVLHETVGLIGDLAKGIGSLMRGQEGAQMIRSLRDAVPTVVGAVRSLTQGFGPAAIDALGSVVKLLGDLGAGAGPLTLVAHSIGTLARAADTLVHALGPVGPTIASALGAFALMKKLNVIGALDTLRGRWTGVGTAAATTALEEQAALSGAAGGGVGVIGARGRAPMVVPAMAPGGRVPSVPGVYNLGAGPGGLTTATAAEAGVLGGGGLAAISYLRNRGVLTAEQAFATNAERLGVTSGARFGAPQLGEISAATQRVGALEGLIGRAGGLVAGVARVVPALMLFQGVLGALGTQGGVGNRALGGVNAATAGLGGKALNALSFGIIPSSPTLPGEKEQAGTAFAQKFLGGLDVGLIPGQSPPISQQRRDIARIQGRLQTISGDDSFDQDKMSLSAATGQLRKELKLRQNLLRQSVIDANRTFDQQSVRHAVTLADQFSQAFDILKGPRGPTGAMRETVNNVIKRMSGLRPAGRKVLGDAMLAWVRQQAQNNPQLWGEYNRLVRGIKGSFNDLHKHIQIVNGQILAGSQQEWKGIGTAMTAPTEAAREEISKNFTAIQLQAVGSLQAMGLSKADAEQLIRGIEKTKLDVSGFSPTQLKTLSTGANVAAGAAKATGGRLIGKRVPGQGTLDTVKLGDGSLGAPGELIVNRHTEADIDRDLIAAGRPTIAARVRMETRKHYQEPGYSTGMRFAGGGALGAAATGAGGGYLFPFSPPPEAWERTDMGVDFSLAAGTKIGPIGRSRVGGQASWGVYGPYVNWQLLDGPRAGQWGYVAEGITNIASPGTELQPDQAVATATHGQYGIEYGWGTSTPGRTLAQATSGYSEGQVTPAGSDMRNFLMGLSHGQIIGGGMGVGAPAVRQIKPLKAPHSKLAAVPGMLSQRAGQAYAKGLTKKINEKLGATAAPNSGGPLSPGFQYRIKMVQETDDPSGNSGGGYTGLPLDGFSEMNVPLGGQGNFVAMGGIPSGTWLNFRANGRTAKGRKVDVGAGSTGGEWGAPPQLVGGLYPALSNQLGLSGGGPYQVEVGGDPHLHPVAHYALGGRLAGRPGGAHWTGWHGSGTDMVVKRPTVFGAGEAGPERVRVTQQRDGSHRVQIDRLAVNVTGGPSEQRVKRMLRAHLDAFAQEVADEIANGEEQPASGALV